MTIARLSQFCSIRSGGTPSRSNAAFYGGQIPWAKISDIEASDGVISETEETISQEGLAAIRGRTFPRGTLLFAIYGSIGKMAFAGRELSTNQAILGIENNRPDALCERYLFRYLESRRDALLSDGAGIAQKNLSAGYVRDMEIPLPPLDDQKRIAAILDQADELRRKRQRSIDRLNQLGQAIFHETFVLGKGEWPEKPLADVVTPGTIVTYGIVQAGDEFPGGVPYIRTGDIKDGQIALGGLRHTDPAIASKFERSRVREGEIVMSIRATVGTVAFVPKELDGANLTQGTARISPGPDVEPWYLIEYIRSPSVQSWIDQQVKGATFREITLTRLREMTVVVPPQKIQRQFSATMDDVSAQLLLEVKSLNEADSLFTSLQHRAFQGEL
jgi:type I restriction enzyme, S subunit